ncbi:MAG: ApaG domain, partial [Gammaproteobacteria bacterium]
MQSRFLPDQSDPDADRFGFAYTIRITNSGTVAAQLISRHWLIQDDAGR